MRRIERERRFQGKYTGYKVTYNVLPQGFATSHVKRGDERRGTNLGSKGTAALLSQSKEVIVGTQHDTEHSDWERLVQGKLISNIYGDNHLSPNDSSQVMIDPETVQEALDRVDRDQWIEAMESEYNALKANETWNLEDLLKGHKPLKSKWIFKIKANPDGTIERHKARLVIKGYSQVKGVDYNETYSPVVRYATIRHLLALAAQLNLLVYQMDAVTAFLQCDLDGEEIYM
ncbi:uncharacterized protein LOC129728739 [Wyeomyia smithii]|uniref:uncharacterized protein LOC129728739 n=1 Tax=Wyeomyia smithii TaxID=174621 RepID=UPI00246805AE|nr:uncharacterized protein LOC129728739 [Wyeomyia smithii]